MTLYLESHYFTSIGLPFCVSYLNVISSLRAIIHIVTICRWAGLRCGNGRVLLFSQYFCVHALSRGVYVLLQ